MLGGYLVLFPHRRVRVIMFRMLTEVPGYVAIGMWFVFQLISGARRRWAAARRPAAWPTPPTSAASSPASSWSSSSRPDGRHAGWAGQSNTGRAGGSCDVGGGTAVVTARCTGLGGRRGERLFFGAMMGLIFVTVFVGFARTYYLSGWFRSPGLPKMTPLVHLHGMLFSGWIVLMIVQTALISGGRTDLHRRLGVFGAGLAALMLVVGTVTALHGVVRGSGPPGTDPWRFLAIPLFDLVVFGTLVGAGIRARRDPRTHKRLMLLATIGILAAAIARWPLEIMQAGPLAFFGINDLFLLPLVAFDLLTLRRVHKATLWGGLLILLSQPLRLLISGTDAWLAFARWAVGLAT